MFRPCARILGFTVFHRLCISAMRSSKWLLAAENLHGNGYSHTKQLRLALKNGVPSRTSCSHVVQLFRRRQQQPRWLLHTVKEERVNCIFCGEKDSKVVDSRPIEEGNTIRRRRQCVACGRRFTTYERSVLPPTLVIKQDGSRQLFDRNEVRLGIQQACEHRNIDAEQIEEIVSKVDQWVRDRDAEEIEAKAIGDLVLEELLKLDQVAYIRYASVLDRFDNMDQFSRLVQQLQGSPNKKSK